MTFSLISASVVAKKVFGVTMTSSPSRRSNICVHRCMPVVQLLTANACLTLCRAANSSWKPFTCGPMVSESCCMAAQAALRSS